MKNSASSITKQLAAKYLAKDKDKPLNNSKSTDINILLNRVKLNQRNESRRKLNWRMIGRMKSMIPP